MPISHWLSKPDSGYPYNAAGLMASNSGTAYTYDASGQRTKKQNGNLYWYGQKGEVLEETDSSGSVISDYIYFNGRRIARRDASGTMYYYITDHIGNVRLVADANAQVVEESDYLPFGTENVITSTITNNYKFIGMERDFEGNAPLDHTLYREYAPNLARWTTPDPVHGTPDNPQSWNRYPYVLNDPLTKIDPLGLVGARVDPFTYTSFVGCRPSFAKLSGQFFGCGWDPDDGDLCPPGYEEIYGDVGLGGGIENLNSVYDYAEELFGGPGGFASNIELGPNGVTITFSDNFWPQLAAAGGIALDTLPEILLPCIGPQAVGCAVTVTSIAAVVLLADYISSRACYLAWDWDDPANPNPNLCTYVCQDGDKVRNVTRKPNPDLWVGGQYCPKVIFDL